MSRKTAKQISASEKRSASAKEAWRKKKAPNINDRIDSGAAAAVKELFLKTNEAFKVRLPNDYNPKASVAEIKPFAHFDKWAKADPEPLTDNAKFGSPSPAHTLLIEAASVVAGPRNYTHGDKVTSFQHIANIWNTYLAARQMPPEGKPDHRITSSDVAQMMVLLKIIRSVAGTPVRDHYLDEAGYAAIAGEISSAQGKF